ncbi:hypothetical protein [Demequina sp. NBRC 110052]|uniref:carboxylate--amine ligase n=1 Tax=Demequina sp. NBRC 110052 TaxID=1570341 RepID=UPI0009FF5C1F|nr:hypothetical protein [Demequina sp. NBRC 110052]
MASHAPFRHILGDLELVPVVLGGDIGAYSIARAFDEAFGVRSVVVSQGGGGTVRDSRIIDLIVEPAMDDPDVVVATLHRVAAERPDATLIVLGSADWHVEALVARRSDLEPRYVVPYVDQTLMDRVTSKEGFAALCDEYGLAHPRGFVFPVAEALDLDALDAGVADLAFPVIAKAGSTAAYHAVEFAGKEKVHTVASLEDLHALMTKVHASGYRDTFLIQDLIPGDDAGLRISNTYVDRHGKASYTVFGHILLQEHTPSTVGNSSVVLTVDAPDAVAALERMLEGIGWRGFGSFDMKMDPRTGEMVFFELNPRLSRSNFFVTSSGLNPAVAYVRDWILDEPVVSPGERGEPYSSLFTVVPTALMRGYLLDEDVRRAIRALPRRRVMNPLWNPRETHPRRLAYVAANQLNHFRKYRTFYPRAMQRAERAAAEAALGR